jgi:hypothetical protein
MDGSKESDLVTAVLMYAIRCLAEGDYAALRSMNFGPKEIEALREMSLSDLYRVETLRAHCLQIVLNRQIYWPMMDHLRQRREAEESQRSLIAVDAPQDMMHTLFGMGPREYTRLRRMLSVAPSVGRPPEPEEDDSHTLWYAWKDQASDDDAEFLSPEAYLGLHEETGLSMRTIWNLTQRWDQYGSKKEHTAAAQKDMNE